jgi:starch phosphorylase
MGGAMSHSPVVAYFSMEVGLEPEMPTYSGGLGILAGDTLRAAADLAIPMVGVTLLHRKGYFRQHLDEHGKQSESPVDWYPEEFLEPQRPRISVSIHGREVHVRAWRYTVHGITGHSVPVFFLDAALEENSEWDQTLTDYLYGGDEHLRLCQEVILGLGGVSMLRALGYKKVTAYHMNEGHSALLVLALLEERLHESEEETITEDDMDAVRQGCVFTTHTPVPAGHDNFPMEMVRQILGAERTNFLISSKCCFPERLNMTYLALTFSRYINGVSLRHGGISQNMFPDYPIDSVSNGVHGLTWTAPPFRRLYDKYMPEWRDDNLYLRYAISIPLDKIISAHGEAKRELFEEIEKRADVTLNPNVMTLGFARRATPYKRADLLFTHTERLRSITNQVGPLQVICGGKAHPRDESGKELIQRIYRAAESLAEAVRVVYLEEHDMDLAKHLCSGVDLWLNTPQKPQEASGTSGMKAALNGVPSLSVLDGWWIEGHVEGVTGWSIGDSWRAESEASEEIASLYDKLETVIIPMFYERPHDYARIMRSAIAINGSFFNAQRMMFQYMRNAYATAEAI